MRSESLADLALADAATGAPDAGERITAVISTVVGGHRRFPFFQALARLCFARSDFAGATEALETALGELDAGDPLAFELLADQLAIANSQPSPATTIANRIQEVIADACAGRPPTEPALLAQYASWQLAAGASAVRARHTAASALAALTADKDQDRFYGIATGYAVLTLIQLDELDLADAPIEAALQRAHDGGSLIGLGFASHWRAMLAYHRGMLTTAVSAAEQTLEVCRAGWDVCRGWVIPVLVHAHLELGNLDSAATALGRAEDIGDGRLEHAHILHARGLLDLTRGDPQAALTGFLAAGSAAERHGITQPTMLAWRSAAATAANLLGQHNYAVELAQTELDQARKIGARRTLGVALRVAGLVTGGVAGIVSLNEAVAVLEQSPAVLERARALIDLGAAQRRDGQRTSSRQPLQRGLELAESLRAAPLAAAARNELHAAGGRRRHPAQTIRPDRLTTTEGRVAELAAQGLSTPHIAKTLYVSTKTIEWHLANIYRKLAIHSRHQLPQTLLRQEPEFPVPSHDEPPTGRAAPNR